LKKEEAALKKKAMKQKRVQAALERLMPKDILGRMMSVSVV
jgi:hypothetical protein